MGGAAATEPCSSALGNLLGAQAACQAWLCCCCTMCPLLFEPASLFVSLLLLLFRRPVLPLRLLLL